ncbi:uncharacterized protein A1O5_01363 [Cladophialophora psammophila CBS 110553]|uniref:Polyketide synthase n=1 Tax=Cladophialophora psammophila CBS 110553 TaxID=1182543 RepID=W9XBG5_9EURO|nr:uncharacterized protein A1O5_01363 [Cladophialophora psammophila CBS 110553]EXJ74670.1 hypothetical protein A1O5_01363 [Cladophialophora psammophila CBS 110553]
MAPSSPTSQKVPVETHQLFLFGDLSFTHFEQPLRRLLHCKSNAVLCSFFDRTSHSIRQHLGTLPLEQQTLFPRFTTLLDLVSRYGETEGTPILKFFLLTVYQIASLIELYTVSKYSLPVTDAYTIGPCAGGFAAAVFSCFRNVDQLVACGSASTLAAFETALLSYVIGKKLSLEPRDRNNEESWSATVTADREVDLEQILHQDAESKVSSRLWVSSITSARSGTMSGLPSLLQDFTTANSSTFRYRYLEIQSPYHASHLFSSNRAQNIVQSVLGGSSAYFAALRPQIPFVSCATGQVANVPDFQCLLQLVVDDALRSPIRWDAAISSYSTLLKHILVKECKIVNFSSGAATMISSRLTNELGIQVQVIEASMPTKHHQQPSFGTGRFDQSKIAIVGYSGRFPSAASNDAFWELLKAGRDVHQEIPPSRFNWETHYDPSGKRKNTSRVKYGCFIDEPGLFDARFFKMSPKEAENTDPAQRLAITTAYEAMEMAGMVPNRTPSTQSDRIGVFFGTTSDDWREVNSGQDVGTYFIPGGNRAFVPGRISYFFGFSGPSISIDTACSSSFAAIQTACGYLWRGECDTTVAGGTNVLTNPDNFAGLDRGHFLSTTGNCDAFDDGANGYCRSEAVATVILKRLEDAVADHDPIFGVIAGTNTNHCGHADSITRPHEGDQASVFNSIIRHANIDPLDVSYVEMHGTGTQAGDATEMNSVLSVFAKDYQRRQGPRDRPLFLGSAKANIGHAESASGVSSLIKVLLMMKHNEIPLHCGIKTKINHNYPLDLAERGVHIASRTVPWLRGDSNLSKRVTFLNNFSAAGGNTAILLEDAPALTSNANISVDQRSTHVVTISGKSPDSLLSNMDAIASFLENKGSKISLPALAYTTTARRMHYNYRFAARGSDIMSIFSALKAGIQELGAKRGSLKPVPILKRPNPSIVFVFSGQGTLYSELAKSLFTTNVSFQASLLQLSTLAQAQGFPDFLGIIDGTLDSNVAGAVATQLALVCVQIALTDLWNSWGISPTAAIGHSLGEYAAFYAAGILSAADTIYLVGTRAQLLEKHCTPGTHSMLAIQGSLEVVSQLLQDSDKKRNCEIACVNSPKAHVVAGPKDCISRVAAAACASGIQNTILDIPFAFHSTQIKPILNAFEQAATQAVVFRPSRIPYLSPLQARAIPAGDEFTLNASYLTAACRAKVDFVGALRTIIASPHLNLGSLETVQWLEIGSHPICCDMVKGTFEPQSVHTHATLRRGVDAYKIITATAQQLYLSGINMEWNEYHRDFAASQEVLQLPSYRWDLKNYWIQYRNDFCLTKGDGPGLPALVQKNHRPANAPKYISPCAQRVVEEQHGADESSILVESDLFDGRLLPILQGHRVNGVALCPSSMYVDVALTMAEYLLRESPESDQPRDPGFEIGNTKIDNPLVAHPSETSHRIGIKALARWRAGVIQIAIFSLKEGYEPSKMHATLEVQIAPKQDWISSWNRTAHLINARIDSLHHSVYDSKGNSECNRMKRRLVYRLFSVLVQYNNEYQGMSEVIINSENLEAAAEVNFQVGKSDFQLDPRWIDSLGQVAGFIMNANDTLDLRDRVFINHGWQRIRFAEQLDATKTYRTYNRMHLIDKETYAGDTYILDGDRIVAVYEGVRFKGIPRQLLDRILPPASNRGSSTRNQVKNSAQHPPTRPYPIPALLDSASERAPEASRSIRTSVPSAGPFEKMLSIISQEVGVNPRELTATMDFAELGVDSLLSLTIIAKARDELGLELSSSLFVECATVQDLQLFLNGPEQRDLASTSQPDSCASSTYGSDSGPSSSSTPLTIPTTPRKLFEPSGSQERLSIRLRVAAVLQKIVAEETGIPDVQPSANLAEIGVDSLLGLTMSSRLQEELGVTVTSSIFLEHEILQSLEKALCDAIGSRDAEHKGQASAGATAQAHPEHTDCTNAALAARPSLEDSAAMRAGEHLPSLSSLSSATSVLLSGSPHQAKQALFLFPDGSGSASSYIAFAEAMSSKDVAVYGLNCPWRKTAAEMTRLGIDMGAMIDRYIVEVERLVQEQPHGLAISVGGWSAGGILAAEAARYLMQRTRLPVHGLVLLDSPNPIGLQNPPARMYDFFDSLGIFGHGGKTPTWLRAHFDAFLRILDKYEPRPLLQPPKTLIVYARDGVCKGIEGPRMQTFPDDPREMLWLLNDREDFSAEGWATVLGGQKLRVAVMDDVNHFSLMDKGPGMVRMASVVCNFLGVTLI